ncbi:MAG: hypothetical protein ACE5JM_12960 [Armatimonadota bacterium]
MWTICVTNDNCPDCTWGFTEEQTRRAFAWSSPIWVTEKRPAWGKGNDRAQGIRRA